MTVKTIVRERKDEHGNVVSTKERVVIHLTVRNRQTGELERYRKDSKIQTKTAAKSEEAGIIAYWSQHGTIRPLIDAQKIERVERAQRKEAEDEKTWSDAVERLRDVRFPMLKPSTRRGYEELLDSAPFKSWSTHRLSTITPQLIAEWDAVLARSTGSSRRRNYHVVLRSALKAAVEAGYLKELPKLPPLPKVPRREVDAPDPEDVEKIISEVDICGENRRKRRRAARLAFAVAAFAGLRAGEVRALRWMDVDLRSATITVRRADSAGEIAAPKSGHERRITIPQRLVALLEEAAKKPHKLDTLVCTRADGQPWGESGLWQALQRTCIRLGITGSRVHALRHFFVTSLFAHGADAITVMVLAGHQDLSTTQRYAHASAARAAEAVANAFDRPTNGSSGHKDTGNGMATPLKVVATK